MVVRSVTLAMTKAVQEMFQGYSESSGMTMASLTINQIIYSKTTIEANTQTTAVDFIVTISAMFVILAIGIIPIL